MEKNELEKVLESKFFCPARFAQEIEGLVQRYLSRSYLLQVVDTHPEEVVVDLSLHGSEVAAHASSADGQAEYLFHLVWLLDDHHRVRVDVSDADFASSSHRVMTIYPV